VEALHPLALHPLECVVDERREVEKSRQPGLDSDAVGGVGALHPLALHPLECVVDERREVEKSRQPGLDSGAVGVWKHCIH